MDEATLRAKLAKVLCLPDVPEEIWHDLIERGFVEEALNPDYDDGWNELRKEAKRLLFFMSLGATAKTRRTPSSGRTPQAQPASILSPRETARALALSLYFARYAATTPRVRRFRANILGGTLLSPVQVEALLISPAPRYLTQAQFKAFGIAIIGHHARTLIYQGWHQVTLQIEWPGGTYQGSFESQVEASQLVPLHFPYQGRVETILAWPGTVFGELGALCTVLAQRYDWQEWEATQFVLTNTAPVVLPLRLDMSLHTTTDNTEPFTHMRSCITLTVDPWVSVESVARAYHQAQQRLFGGANRPVQERSLALVRFHAEHMDDLGEKSWSTLRKMWNQEYPAWHYEDERLFPRDMKRALRAIILPKRPV